MEFIGIDLAWNEGSLNKRANESGVVMLSETQIRKDEDGRIPSASSQGVR